MLIITECPCCATTLQRVKDQLFCRNASCEAQGFKKLEKYGKALKIKGLGPRTIEKLELESIPDLYDLSAEYISATIGATMGAKLYNEIQKSKVTTVSDLLPALSIPLIGKTAATKVNGGISSISEITPQHCSDIGLGEKATRNLLQFLETQYEDIGYIFGKVAQNVPDAALGTVVLTGKLVNGMSRAQATTLLQGKGYKVTGSVSKNTDYLICEDGSTSSKLTKAQDLGITITTIQELTND